jgi:hypothetical protein
MDPVFGTLWIDLPLASVFGAIGGFGLGLLQEKGLEMPHTTKDSGVAFMDFGYIADIIVGAVAAVIIYAVNPPGGLLQMIAVTVTAGIGGSGILKGYIKDTAAKEQAKRAEMYKLTANAAADNQDITSSLAELAKVDEKIMERFGPR